jgi:DNA-binding response OmpR family regulator
VKGKVLVVDDEAIVTEIVERYLTREGYEVRVTGDGMDALEAARKWAPDLIVLDLMLPTVDGLEVCRKLRMDTRIPIIMLTARGEETDRIVGLELGADDYMVKPFSPRELVARVKAVLRRAEAATIRDSNGLVPCGGLRINPETREVWHRGREVSLTSKEFDLLYFLAMHPNQVFTREQLLDQVWDYTYAAEQSTVTVHIRRLRAKIEDDPIKPRCIKTLWGVGYKFQIEGDESND